MNRWPLLLLAFTLAGGAGAGRAASTSAEFTAVQRLTNREMFLQVTAPTGGQYRIAVSTNLSTFQSLVTAVNAGVNQHTDSAASYLPARFYRAELLADTNALTGDHLATTNGEFVLHAVNHASLVLSYGDKMIYVDPAGAATNYQGLAKADLILVTHGHPDHFNTTILDAVRGTAATILTSQTVFNSMNATFKARTGVLTNGMATNLLGFTIEAVPAYNLIANYHPKGVGNGYVLAAGGKRIYIAGDTEDTPEMRALRNIDVAFVPMNLPYTMTVEKAASAVRDFRPVIVYPCHYSPSSPASDVILFKQLVGTDLGIEVRFRKWY